jgi:hypothetical protein
MSGIDSQSTLAPAAYEWGGPGASLPVLGGPIVGRRAERESIRWPPARSAPEGSRGNTATHLSLLSAGRLKQPDLGGHPVPWFALIPPKRQGFHGRLRG